jgi:hypothetical protein
LTLSDLTVVLLRGTELFSDHTPQGRLIHRILFLDVGLMQRSLGLAAELMFHDNLMTENLGVVIEQYVGQESLAAIDWYEERNLLNKLAVKKHHIQTARTPFRD